MKICYLYTDPPDGHSRQANWLHALLAGGDGLDPGKQHTFKVKPGTYVASMEACNHGVRARDQPIEITGPTYLSLGEMSNPPNGYAVIKLHGAAGESCFDGGQPNVAAATDCCSKTAHREGTGEGYLVCD